MQPVANASPHERAPTRSATTRPGGARTSRSALRTHLLFSGGLAILLVSSTARAETLVFSEDWESGTARWHTTDSNPITLATDPSLCSSSFQRETVPADGGRVFTSAGIPVTGGETYCLVAWMRGTAGTQPFLGINLANAAGTPGAEHWLIGQAGYSNGYGGTVTTVTADNNWHWYQAEFTVETSATHVVIKDELFSTGAPGTASFDDIRLYVGGCPIGPVGSAHLVCPSSTPICTTAGQCVQCTTNDDCPTGTEPVCLSDATCGCASNSDCSGATPVCDSTIRSCVAECVIDADCTTAPNNVCDTSATPQVCVECTATNTTACSPTGRGSACLSTNTCGCVTNGDCGGGRACDTTTAQCVTLPPDAGPDTADATEDTSDAAGDASDASDTGGSDASDTAVADTTTRDSGGTATDSGVADTGKADTSDSGSADTSPADASVTDSSVTDSSVTDSSVTDGFPEDAPLEAASLEGGAGCGCATPRTAGDPRGWIALAVALALAARRRPTRP